MPGTNEDSERTNDDHHHMRREKSKEAEMACISDMHDAPSPGRTVRQAHIPLIKLGRAAMQRLFLRLSQGGKRPRCGCGMIAS